MINADLYRMAFLMYTVLHMYTGNWLSSISSSSSKAPVFTDVHDNAHRNAADNTKGKEPGHQASWAPDPAKKNQN
jgi:hypothetical protein